MRFSFSRWVSALTCAVLLSASTLVATAQNVTASISGTVTDPSGAVVPKATITITNTDTNTVRTLEASGSGAYSAPSLPLGTYTVTIEAPGFKKQTVTGLVLHVNDAATVNGNMAVGSSGDEISVAADQVQLNFENATVSGLINGTQMRELVLNNRNYEQLVALQPGVAYGGTSDQLYIGNSLPGGTTATVAFSINGGRSSANNWTIDGTTNVDRGSNLTLLSYPSIDAIAEFKTLRGTYTAEFGGAASGQINVVTRSGTNSLHGTLYEFFRNDVFNANAWLNKNVPNPANFGKRPALRYNDFGGEIAGPIVIPHIFNGKDKAFFMFSGEYRRVINYSAITNTGVPTATERQGNFATPVCTSVSNTGTCNSTGTTVAINPTAAAYVKDMFTPDGSKIPLPIVTGTDPTGHTILSNQRAVYNENQEIARIDYSATKTLLLTGRMIYDEIPTVEPGGAFTSASSLPGAGTTANESHTNSPGHNYLGRFTWTATPKLVVEGGYDYSYGAIISTPTGYIARSMSPDINPTLPFDSKALGIVPTISMSGGGGPNVTSSGQYNVISKDHNVFGQATRSIGGHTLIAGATFHKYLKSENATTSNAGTFTFNATGLPSGSGTQNYTQTWANFLSGYAASFSQASLAITPALHSNIFEAFVQDNWKVNPRLALNLGVRYTYFQQPTDSNNYLDNFDPSTYVASKAPTLDTNGLICVTGAACTGGVTPNPSADYVTNNGALLLMNGVILATPGSFGHQSPYGNTIAKQHNLNFAPRLGFALDVFGDQRTSLRGGYGISFDSTLFGTYEQNSFANPPYVQTFSYANVNFNNPAATSASTTATPSPGALRGTATDFKTPYTQQYSLGIQQQMPLGMVLHVDYVGNHQVHQLGIIDINEATPGAYVNAGLGIAAGGVTTANSPKLNLIRPYKGYNAINVVQNIFGSNYNSLQTQLQKRFRDSSLIDINYTWSKALTDNQTDRSTAVQDRTNIRGEYGLAQIDRRNIFTADFVYVLPFYRDQKGFIGHIAGGWQLSGIAAINSGLPFTPTTSSVDPGGLGFLGASSAGGRPDQVGNVNDGVGLKTKTKWFNTAAFAAVPAGLARPGNSHRGVIIGPGFQRYDLGLMRNFKLAEGKFLQFRGEGFNVFNHTNFATIAVAQTTPSTFGTVTAARDNRILQVALKLNF